MIEGVVHHCTEMEVDRQYVDTHGQSTVAFAFCRLLGFQLMPRLKAIHSQKLSRPDVGEPDAYPNLQAILTKPIDWELIRQRYDQMVSCYAWNKLVDQPWLIGFQHTAEPGTQGLGRGKQDVRGKAAQAARRRAPPASSQSDGEAGCIRELLPALRRLLFGIAAVRLRGL